VIKISSVSFKNFLSVGNVPVNVCLDSHKKTIISGKNGQGKSILCDVIVYALFGKPFRDIKKPQLMNSINKKELEVTIHFSIKDTQYKIIRGMWPGIFEIYANDVLLPPDSRSKDYQRYLEEEILNMNLKTFTQIVILGSSNYVPFMRMGAQSKREIIEDILNITIFSRMNELLKIRLKDHEVSLQLAEKDKELIKKQYSFLYEKFSQNKFSLTERVNSKKEYLDELSSGIFNHVQALNELNESLKPVPFNLQELKAQRKKLESFRIKIESNLQRANKEIQFYEENTKCSKCNTELTEEHKQKHTTVINTSKEKFTQALSELDSHIAELDKKILEATTVIDSNNFIQTKINNTTRDKQNLENTVLYVQKEIKDIETSSADVIKEDEVLALKESLKATDADIISKYHELDILKKGIHILKDTGAKTRIINFYLPLINNTVNSYLEKFNFNVLFSFNENFEETFKARGCDNYSYGNFSEGEKLRLDLCILFAFREIAKRKNSAAVNLLFFDEILDSSLDSVGIENFFAVADETGTEGEQVNFIVISHREGVDSYFDRTLTVTKNNGFSAYKEIS